MRQVSPVGGSTLITSAPKSDRITAAPGPAMKLAKSTTFSPEKMLSLAMGCPFRIAVCVGFSSPSAELWCALFEEGSCPFLLVLGCGAEPEVGGLEQQAFALARLHPLVCRLKRELDGNGSVGGDFRQGCLGALDQTGGRNDLVDQADAISLLRCDHLAGEDELKSPPFADEPWQALRSAAARYETEHNFRLSKLRVLHRDPDGARHRRLTAATERKAIHGGDDRLSEAFDEIQAPLSEQTGSLSLERHYLRELADVGACDESLLASACQNDASYRGIVPGVLEGPSQVRPRRRIQSVEDFRAIYGDVGNAALLLIEDVCERQARRF